MSQQPLLWRPNSTQPLLFWTGASSHDHEALSCRPLGRVSGPRSSSHPRPQSRAHAQRVPGELVADGRIPTTTTWAHGCNCNDRCTTYLCWFVLTILGDCVCIYSTEDLCFVNLHSVVGSLCWSQSACRRIRVIGLCFKLNTLILDPWTRKLIWFGPIMNLEFDVRVFQ